VKIGFFTDSYLPNVDGVVKSITTVRPELERRGNEVFVFTSGTRSDSKANRDAQVFYYRSFKFPAYPQYKIALFPYYSARSKARDLSLELVHCHGMASMGIAGRKTARDLGVPVVGSFHTLLPKGIQTITKRKWTRKLGEDFLWRAMDWFYKPLDLVISPSETIRKVLLERKIDSVVVPNGLDTKYYSAGNKAAAKLRVSRKIGLKQGEKLVLSAGRMSKEKNHDLIVRAAQSVLKECNARFVFTGDGPARKEIEALAAKMGLSHKLVFPGFVSDAELLDFYRAADVFVTASTFETQGMALLEAMACGTPVVGADSLAIPEVVFSGRNGFLFEPYDSGECAQKIVKVLAADKSSYSKMAKAARATAEKFSVPQATDKLLKAYQLVL